MIWNIRFIYYFEIISQTFFFLGNNSALPTKPSGYTH